MRCSTPRLARLRLVIEADFDFTDDETPSLPGMPVVEAEGEDVTDMCRPLAKCGAAGAERGRKAGGR
jgi:hypothetical protein